MKERIYRNLLLQVANLDRKPQGAYNLRADGEGLGRNTTATIDIVTKEDNSGIDIIVKPNTKGETIHIPVVISQSGLKDLVYNDFYIGENSEVTIIAGCAIHNSGDEDSGHDGIHRFFLEKNARVKYIEKHFGEGEGAGKRILNPTTIINLEEGSYLEMDSFQIQGVDLTKRVTEAVLDAKATLIVTEKIMTDGQQYAETVFKVEANGEDSSTHLVSRSVARDNSYQKFISQIDGNNKCSGHSECDAIIMDNGRVTAIPEVTANHVEANLIHEAVIGKIAGEQLIKLMTLGLNEKEAEAEIISGFMK
ncbi:MAG: SufB/SufD family protein [Desulfitobacteriia bacterium]